MSGDLIKKEIGLAAAEGKPPRASPKKSGRCRECGESYKLLRLQDPKSLVRELYPDSIDVDGESRDNGRVSFEPFVGVAPRRFRQFFEMRLRKDLRGQAVRWEGDGIRLNLGDYIPNHELIKQDEAEFILEVAGTDSEEGTDETSKGERE